MRQPLVVAGASVSAIAAGVFVASGVQPLPVLAGCSFLGVVVLGLLRPEFLFLAAASAMLAPSIRLFETSSALLAFRWVALIALGGALAARASLSAGGRQPLLRGNPWLFSLLLIASTAWSIAPTLTLGRSVSFACMILFGGLLVQNHVTTETFLSALRLLAGAVALGGLVALALGIRAASGRYAGIFENPNFTGVANALLFPVSLSAALSTQRLPRLGHAAVASALAVESVLAASRGGLLAMTIAYLVLIWPEKNRRRHGVLVMLLPVAVAVTMAVQIEDQHRFSTTNTRTSLWGVFDEIFLERPLVGHGFGTTQLTLRPYGSVTGYTGEAGVDLHNSYLNLLVDGGIIGATAFAVALLGAVRGARRHEPVLLAIVLAGLTSALFESWLFSVGSGFPVIFWLTLMRLRNREPDRQLVPA